MRTKFTAFLLSTVNYLLWTNSVPEDCTCKKLRLLLRLTLADYNGIAAERIYKTVIVFVPDEKCEIFQEGRLGNYEIIGGEWLKKELRYAE